MTEVKLLKILITGINGFIGRSIVEGISQIDGYDIVGVGQKEKYTGNEIIDYIKSDISKDSFVQAIKSLVKNCDIIIHAAAVIDKDNFNKSILSVNCIGTHKILELAKLTNCKKIIYISSVPVIGIPIQQPITEEHPTNPQTLYHASKLFGENTLLLGNNLGIDTVVLRITAPIGRSMPDNRVLKAFILSCLTDKDLILYGNGTRLQNYIDVRDISDIIIKVLGSKVRGVFNIAGDKVYTNLEVANLCISITKAKSKIIFNGMIDPEEDFNWDVSIQKAYKELKYIPTYSLRQSIEDIIAGVKEKI
jgi:UDP-glucose 4-epimerase